MAAAAGLGLSPTPAPAETPVETRISPPPTFKPRLPARRPSVEPPAEEEVPSTLPARRPADAGEEEERDEAGTARQFAPAAALDGDMGWQVETQAPLDGIIEVDEPAHDPDGIADPRRDRRTPREVSAFDGLPAGYNPYLFQIEPEPLADRRIAQLFYLEPYTARGIRIGSFVLFPEAEIGAIGTNNLFRSASRRADSALETSSRLRFVSDWRTHAVELRAAGLASFYQEVPTEDDRAYTLEARGRLDLAKRTDIEALASHRLDKAIRSARDFPTDAAERGDIETNRAAVAFNHRFSRLGLQLRGALTDVDYAPVPALGGGIIGNDERDFTQRDAALRVSWALNRKTDVFAETARVDREYHAAPADGILRSSQGERYRLGVAFGPWDATIRGEASVGWGRQEPNDPRLGSVEGLIVDANLAWRATALTTVLLTASSDFFDTTVAGSGGTLSRTAGLEMRHAFRRHLIGMAGVRYAVSPYDGVELTERTLTAEAGVDYYLGRDLILYGRYQHIDFQSTAPGSDWAADIVRMGLRLRQ